ncbi:MAG: winged helix-turn-helix domain-containing protein [Aridibacter sp.]
MAFPKPTSVETPILQELVAVGGADDLKFLYERLIAYFPQLTSKEITEIQINNPANWRKLIQRAGRELDEKGLIERHRGFWKITEKGQKQVEAEVFDFELTKEKNEKLSHNDIQKMISKIGSVLGFYSEMEFEFYDVVWREVPQALRLSHVFEVQSKGNIDSAFAKLKRAYEAQRSKIFLVISSERDLNRAGKSLQREFQDIENNLTIITFAQIKSIHQNLISNKEILAKFLES